MTMGQFEKGEGNGGGGGEEGGKKHNFEGGIRVCLSVFVVDKSGWEKQESGRER